MHLAAALETIRNAGLDFIHYDVVDGVFNDCFVFGDLLLSKVTSSVDIPVEVHLACQDPMIYLQPFVRAGASVISVHYEASGDWRETFSTIRKYGAVPAIAFRAETPIPDDFEEIADEVPWILQLTVNPGYAGQHIQDAVIDKIHEMRRRLIKAGLNTGIQADGNVNPETIPLLSRAGADILTGGTSGLFRPEHSVRENLRQMKEAYQPFTE
jgi:ribulose-phosphate 3-epimerase